MGPADLRVRDVVSVQPELTNSEDLQAVNSPGGVEKDLGKPGIEIAKEGRVDTLRVPRARPTTEEQCMVLRQMLSRKRRQPKSQRHTFNNLSAVAYSESPNDNTAAALSTFFATAQYRNPEVLLKLEEIGFGPHELLTMKGLLAGAIARRFRHLIGKGTQSVAQVESLSFAVAHATPDAWSALERHI